MKAAYSPPRVELQGKGFTVVPDLVQTSPRTAAPDYFNRRLAKAEVSVHLVGEKPGFAPAGSIRW